MKQNDNTKAEKGTEPASEQQGPALGVQTDVYARHGHELLGCKSPICELLYLSSKVQQLLAKGNCKAARLCGKEACSKSVSRRTETSYKAESAGKLAHDNKARGSAEEPAPALSRG